MNLILKEKLQKFNDDIKGRFDNFDKKFNTLSKREKRYFKIILNQSGVLYLKSHPGLGKSATLKSIAKKMGMNYFDVRLSLVDETDVGLYPDVQTIKDEKGKDIKVLAHVVPEWSVKSNQAPSLIAFDEINRSRLEVRNAALQLLLERAIGTKFKFNSNVFMCACGNLGDEDGTDVDELDSALNNRLIHVRHDMPFDEWYESFAKDNIIPEINEYLKHNKSKLFVPPNYDEGGEEAYPTNRTWTFLSDHLLKNCYSLDKNGEIKVDREKLLEEANSEGASFIGNDIIRFIKFLEDYFTISIEDIIFNYDSVEDKLNKWKDKKSVDSFNRIINELSKFDYDKVREKESKNIVKFLKLCNEELIYSYIDFIFSIDGVDTYTSEEEDTIRHPLASELNNNFPHIIKKMVNTISETPDNF